MQVRRSTQLAAAVALSAAVVVGLASPASASPSRDPLAPITAAAGSASVGELAAPQGVSGQTLLAAHNAGIPIYELAQTRTYYTGKIGYYNISEYRRVHDANILGSPTAKFVTFGDFPPDIFYTKSYGDQSILVNLHEIYEPNLVGPTPKFDTTPDKFNMSPLIQLPGGGPSVGLAFVSESSSSSS
ncbi:hypothetical protein [Rhodococcus sp. NPDC049939]|uniref:hypothetical protein n=1 Tax=Rhodococcus sp. NPDC049939 TaxID=3155511 RepID=UPI0033D1A709